MQLHCSKKEFNELVILASEFIGVPEEAVKKDYFIVKILKNIQDHHLENNCIFKGGTSLSKCYPNSINRFSEDIDLTYITDEELKDKQYDRKLKEIEIALADDLKLVKIDSERTNRSKSSYVYFSDDETDRIKLEIGSQVRPEPIVKKSLKSYIQEFLEAKGLDDDIKGFGLQEISINTLSIERTFIDKLFAVRRHAIIGSLPTKVRHIYDVVKLFDINEIQEFLSNKDQLKRVVCLTKETDAYYLKNKHAGESTYNSLEPYSFKSWMNKFDGAIKKRYETLHLDLLYTNEAQNFSNAIKVFTQIDDLLSEIAE